jgi:6-pyruvoyltetrahydropterin/6-carboxytetrahydropterin synthase
MRVRRRFRFEAAHRLPEHPGKCRELHGHSYELVIDIERAIDERSGMVIDFSELKRIVRETVVDRLDHRCLNDVIANPTAELTAAWIWSTLQERLPGLVEIELHETRDCSVVYRGR